MKALKKVNRPCCVKMGLPPSWLGSYLKKVIKAFKKDGELKILRSGIISIALLGSMLCSPNVFANLAAPATSSLYMGYGTSPGSNGGNGSNLHYDAGDAECKGGGGGSGQTGSPNPLTINQANLASSGYGTGVYALATGGNGGNGGNNTDSSCPGYNARSGGTGGNAAPVNVTFAPAAAPAGIANTTLSYTGIYAVSGGGNGGDGGYTNQVNSSAGNGNTGGSGGAVTVTNSTSISAGYITGGYGIYALSYGGNGGQGGDANTCCFAGDGGGGGYGGTGGSVQIVNSASIYSPIAIPIFAQSLGGTGAAGGSSTGGVFSGGSGGGGGNGSAASWVSVSNSGSLSTYMTGGFGILAQSVGGSGGTAGVTAGLVALGGKRRPGSTGWHDNANECWQYHAIWYLFYWSLRTKRWRWWW